MEKMKRHNYLDTVDQVLSEAVEKRLLHLTTEEQEHQGKYITLEQHRLLNFGSCSYLGLETEPSIIAAIIDTAQRYGSQFSSSRAYTSCAPYQELETHLQAMFGKPVVVTASTTLGHISAIPVLIDDQDAVLLDHQVHASVQTAAQLLKPRGVHVSLIRHNRLDMLESQIEQLKKKHRHIWYLIDGVYSMYGDTAPLVELYQLLDKHPQLHLYVDDAHGMSWAGPNSTGFARSQIEQHDKMMLVTSLNKAFASAGGVLVFPNQEWARRVKTCGGTLIFSGPVQPPMLGAAIASAKLHLSGQLTERQQQLQHNINFTNQQIRQLGLPIVSESQTPIFFIAAGLPKVVHNLVHRLKSDGFYTNIATFPAVPMKNGGVRFTVTSQHQDQDIAALLHSLRQHYEPAIAEEQSSFAVVQRNFKLTEQPQTIVEPENQAFEMTYVQDIAQIDAAIWDPLLGNRGSFDHQGLQFLQRNFSNPDYPEHHWDFHYLLVRDAQSKQIILASFFTVALCKDDMFAHRSVSAEIEQQRTHNPLYLTSKVLMLGSLMTEGEHLYLDRNHPQWQAALECLMQKMEAISTQQDCNAILWRDFHQQDSQLEQYFLQQGYIKYQLPHTHQLQQLNWQNTDEYLAWLPHKMRWHVRREILDHAEQFRIDYSKQLDEQALAECYQLYGYVQQRGLDINSFRLPLHLFRNMVQSDGWDIIRLFAHHEQQAEKLVAVVFSYHGQDAYCPMLIGLDYRFIASHKVYKQALYQVVQRARQLQYQQVYMGFTAHTEKRKVGATAIATHGYIQAKEHFSADLIENMVVKS